MNYLKIFTSSILGTSAMTLYSYWRSGVKEKNFREPQLLNSMMDNLNLGIKIPNLAGWILHYKVGLGFTLVYHSLWKTAFPPTLISGSLMGAVNGFIGIAVWNTALKKHPNPPLVDEKAFYTHLFIAHVIFGAFSAIGYNMEKIK